MTLYDVFNESFGRIPKLALEAQKLIAVYGWPEIRKRHAYIILGQLQGGGPLIKENCKSVGITLVRLKLTISPGECGLDESATFDEQNIKKANQYVKELIIDLNDIVKDIEFRYEGHYPKKDTCEYTISWKF